MEDNTRRQITWVIVIGLIAILVIVAAQRRTALNRAITKLERGTPAERAATVRGLVNSHKLADALEGQSRWVQDRAVAAVAQIGTPQALQELAVVVPLLDQPVAAAAKDYLIMMGEQAIGPMVAILYHKEKAVRGVAPGVLAKIGPPALPTLLGMLDVYDDDARAGVLGALAGMGEPAVDPLIQVLKKTAPGPDQSAAEFVREQDTAYGALKAMKVTSMGPVMAELLTHQEPPVRETAARLVGDVIDQTAKFYEHPAVAEPIQLVTPIALEDAQTAVAPLVDRLRNDPDWRVRRQAALSLGRLFAAGNQPNIVSALVAHLADRRSEVKAAAAAALGQIGATQIASTLVETLLTNRAGAVTELQLAIRRLGPPAIAALAPALSSSSTEVRELAAEILAGIGGRQAVAPLAACLSDSDEVIRRLAAETLADMTVDTLVPMATPAVVSSLLAALDDPAWQVYHEVRAALARIGEKAVAPLITKLGAPDIRSRFMAQQALADIGGPAIESLLGALRSSSGEIRHWAAVTLGKIGPDVIGPTTRIVNNPTESSATRAAAVRALGYTRSPAATDALTAAADASEPQVRAAVLKAINDLWDAAGTETLVAALQDADSSVRDVATALLKGWQLDEVTDLLNKVLNEGDDNAQRRAAVILAYHVSPAANRLLSQVIGSAAEAAESGKIVKVLTAIIEDPSEDLELRQAAVSNLGAVGTPASVGVLEAMLTPDSEFVAGAASSVAQIGLRTAQSAGEADRAELGRAARLLIKVLKEVQDDMLREQVARALTTMKGLPVAELIEGLGTYPDELKPWAAAILAIIGEPATEPMLSARGASEDREHRLWCVAALEASGSMQARRLINYLDEEEKPDEERMRQVKQMRRRILGYE